MSIIIKTDSEIEKMRMESRLRYSMQVDKDLYDLKIPPMILQILVENAIKHGLAPKKEGGQINIQVERIVDNIAIKVSDTGVGISDNRNPNGFGLYSIQQRLKLVYEKAKFDIAKQQCIPECHLQGLSR